jgi:hypothetical protein
MNTHRIGIVAVSLAVMLALGGCIVRGRGHGHGRRGYGAPPPGGRTTTVFVAPPPRR